MTPREAKRQRRMEHRLRKIDFMQTLTCVVLVAGIALCVYINAKAEALQEPETETPATVDTPAEEKPAQEAENGQSAPTFHWITPGEPQLAGATLPQPEPEPEPEPEPKPAPRYDATEAELDIVARVVHSEAVGEGFDGMALVAQCILNTCEATGKRPDEVVTEPGQYAAPAQQASAEVIAAVEAVFLDGYQVTTEPIRFFYAPARCYSSWHENSLEYVGTWGGHRFFKVKGV